MPVVPFQPINLGDRVKDPITGFTGIVIVISSFLHGCVRIGVQPETLHEGKPKEEHYFDQSQLVLIDKRVHEPMVLEVVEAPPTTEKRRSIGGPAREGKGFRK